MKILRMLLVPIVLAVSCLPAAAACALERLVHLPMRTLPDGRVTVPMKLQDREYQMMVDTGGYISTIDMLTARELKLQPRISPSGRLVGLGTTMMNKYVSVPQIALGGLPGRNFEFFVDPSSDLGASGVLAPQIMAAYDTELDFANEKFSLFRPKSCAGSASYWADESFEPVPFRADDAGHIVLELRVGGQELDAVMDTGAPHSLIGMRDARRYLGIKENDPNLRSLGIRNINGVADEVFLYPFPELQFGGVIVKNPQIEIVSDRVTKNFHMIVGMGILRQLHLYIAYKERKLYLTPALAAKKPD